MKETYCAIAKKLPEGIQVQADARGRTFLFDEPKPDGNDEGPTPIDMLLAAVGACQTMTAWKLAAKMQIKLENLSIDVQADFDLDASNDARPDAPKAAHAMRSIFHIRSSAPREKLERLVELTEKHCPVGSTVFHGTPITHTFVME